MVDGRVETKSNHSGGTLGGISNGMPLVARVAFKPTSSIRLPVESITLSGTPVTFAVPPGSRHDPCVAIRAVPVVEAVLRITLADRLLANRTVRTHSHACVYS